MKTGNSFEGTKSLPFMVIENVLGIVMVVDIAGVS